MDWKPELAKASLNLLVALLTLGTGWFIGQRLSFRWAIRQKQRELLLAASNQFYSAYGEFFTVWKLWNRLNKDDPSYSEKRWHLLQQAAQAEASTEAILLKIVTELTITPEEAADLGRFRQAFQSLREAIREDKYLDWHSSQNRQYIAFKRLSCRVASLLQSEKDRKRPNWQVATESHKIATSNKWEADWWSEGI